MQAIEKLWRISNDQLPQFDAWFREECSTWFYPDVYSNASSWHRLAPTELDRVLADYGEGALPALLLCTCHPSGYVRERALNLCMGMDATRVIPFCLVRLNDWVPAVRAVALQSVRRWLEEEESLNLLPLLPLFFRLEECHRSDHREVLGIMAKHLQGASRDQVIQGMRDPSPIVRRICYDIGMDGEASKSLRREAIQLGLCDPLPHLRMKASNHGKAFGLEFADVMLADPFMPIRRNGLELHVDSRSEQHQSLLENGREDSHRSIRELSRYWLKTLGYQTEFAGHYRAQLNQNGAIGRISLLGLGETGTKEDCSQLSEFLNHVSPRHREAAVRGLATLDFSSTKEMILARVADSSGRVSRMATNSFLARPVGVSVNELLPLLESTDHDHVRSNAFRLLRKASKWDRIQILLTLALHDATSEKATGSITQWLYGFNRSFAQPTQEQVRNVRTAFDKARSSLPRRLQEELSGLLETLSPRS